MVETVGGGPAVGGGVAGRVIEGSIVVTGGVEVGGGGGVKVGGGVEVGGERGATPASGTVVVIAVVVTETVRGTVEGARMAGGTVRGAVEGGGMVGGMVVLRRWEALGGVVEAVVCGEVAFDVVATRIVVDVVDPIDVVTRTVIDVDVVDVALLIADVPGVSESAVVT